MGAYEEATDADPGQSPGEVFAAEFGSEVEAMLGADPVNTLAETDVRGFRSDNVAVVDLPGEVVRNPVEL